MTVEIGDTVVDTAWDSESEVVDVDGDDIVLEPETWHGQPNTRGVTTTITRDELLNGNNPLEYQG